MTRHVTECAADIHICLPCLPSRHPVPAALAFVTLLFILSCLLPPSDGLAPSHDAPSTPKRWANYLALTQWMGHSLDVADDKGRLWNSAWDDSTSSSLGDEA